jgi:hypothetical protein
MKTIEIVQRGQPSFLRVKVPRPHISPVTVVVISSGGKGNQHAGSLDVKVPDGQETGRIRTGGRANWQAVANV